MVAHATRCVRPASGATCVGVDAHLMLFPSECMFACSCPSPSLHDIAVKRAWTDLKQCLRWVQKWHWHRTPWGPLVSRHGSVFAFSRVGGNCPHHVFHPCPLTYVGRVVLNRVLWVQRGYRRIEFWLQLPLRPVLHDTKGRRDKVVLQGTAASEDMWGPVRAARERQRERKREEIGRAHV